MKRKVLNKIWRAAPLPSQFNIELENGRWLNALHIYQRHPYHAPPVDTFDLLKLIMKSTNVRVDDVKNRFNEKIRLSAILQRKTPEEVEWGTFWTALNAGDSKTISAALTGARISAHTQQIGVAEACAVLLKSAGENWEHELVDSAPFATVTRSNLVHVALTQQRCDIATELLRCVRITRSDLLTLWPLMSNLQWEQVLRLVSACPKNSVPYDVVLRHILQKGCDLQTLSLHLEQAHILGDVDVATPLISHAIKIENWEYVCRGMAHLEDIGQITQTTRQVFMHLAEKNGMKKVCERLKEYNMHLHELTIESLEQLKL